jgi:hypothetical protein
MFFKDLVKFTAPWGPVLPNMLFSISLIFPLNFPGVLLFAALSATAILLVHPFLIVGIPLATIVGRDDRFDVLLTPHYLVIYPMTWKWIIVINMVGNHTLAK